MTIDEAIEHAKEVSRTCDDNECAAEHMQLAEWLRQARGATKAARWYTEKIRKLEAENSMLRERLLESRESNEHLYTELRRYKSIFRMEPRAMNALFDENSKLRELTSRMYKNMQGVLRLSTDTVFVNSLVTLRECMDEHMKIMAELGMPPSDYESRMRELGIEED